MLVRNEWEGEGYLRSAYLDLQDVVETTDTLIVHFVICIIRITTTLILNEGESTLSVNDIRVDLNGELDQLTDDSLQFGVPGYRNGQADRNCKIPC